MITVKSAAEIALMREAGRRLAYILEKLAALVAPGVPTKFLDEQARALLQEVEAKAAFLGYAPGGRGKPFPAALCVSVNETIVHGIPGERVLAEGDLVKLDMGLIYQGFYVDAAVSVGAGALSATAAKLLSATREALWAGIRNAKAGNTVGDIGWAIEKAVERHGFSVADSLTGHGIGRALHEDPTIFNSGRRGSGEPLEVGMALAIEPMVVAGDGAVREREDGSFISKDGTPTAHFEHTVAITRDGPKILTRT
jgi:methionyl aminopeptidase